MERNVSTPDLILPEWAKSKFGVHAPHINTLRRWVREGRITPQPQKVGKTYFVKPTAEYQGN